MSTSSPVLVWFRNDLRLHDNPALHEAVQQKVPVLCFYILEEGDGLRPLGGASKWWLHGSLAALQSNLKAIGGDLVLMRGAASKLVPNLARAVQAKALFWNRRYDEAERALDSKLKEQLEGQGVAVTSFNGHLIHEPWEVRTGSGSPFKVFTPFWRSALTLPDPPAPVSAPQQLQGAALPESIPAVALESLALEPKKPNWAAGFSDIWTRGEQAARLALTTFTRNALSGYADGRNHPSKPSTSRLSPHLRFGEVSVRAVFHAIRQAALSGEVSQENADKYLSELGWRDFSYNLLYHFGDIATKNVNPRFDAFPYESNPHALEAWQHARTGYPIVDAGLRQLWQTGYMHNRVRMITASFLIKHLLIDWREGEKWFWDTLVDADPANNGASWQWVAGSGSDAAPYHRIFNPVLQGEKFDEDGAYVRQFVPELSRLPDAFLHKPWEAPKEVLAKAGIVLGETYPKPIVDHDMARKRALAALEAMKG